MLIFKLGYDAGHVNTQEFVDGSHKLFPPRQFATHFLLVGTEELTFGKLEFQRHSETHEFVLGFQIGVGSTQAGTQIKLVVCQFWVAESHAFMQRLFVVTEESRFGRLAGHVATHLLVEESHLSVVPLQLATQILLVGSD